MAGANIARAATKAIKKPPMPKAPATTKPAAGTTSPTPTAKAGTPAGTKQPPLEMAQPKAPPGQRAADLMGHAMNIGMGYMGGGIPGAIIGGAGSHYGAKWGGGATAKMFGEGARPVGQMLGGMALPMGANMLLQSAQQPNYDSEKYSFDKYSALGKLLGKAVPGVGTAIDAYSGYQTGGVKGAIGTAGGGVAGTLGGAAIGSLIAPGPGTVIGGIIGGLGGSMAGQAATAKPVTPKMAFELGFEDGLLEKQSRKLPSKQIPLIPQKVNNPEPKKTIHGWSQGGLV